MFRGGRSKRSKWTLRWNNSKPSMMMLLLCLTTNAEPVLADVLFACAECVFGLKGNDFERRKCVERRMNAIFFLMQFLLKLTWLAVWIWFVIQTPEYLWRGKYCSFRTSWRTAAVPSVLHSIDFQTRQCVTLAIPLVESSRLSRLVHSMQSLFNANSQDELHSKIQ